MRNRGIAPIVTLVAVLGGTAVWALEPSPTPAFRPPGFTKPIPAGWKISFDADVEYVP